MTQTTSTPGYATTEQRRELAQAISVQAQAIADGQVVGPEYAAVRRLLSNVDTLTAWTRDDRA